MQLPIPMDGLSSNTAFIPNTTVQWAWDSTSLGELKWCARKYYYSIIWGWQTRETSVHLFFGILYHQALEYYDRLKFEGKSHDEALILVIRRTLVQTWNKELKRPWISDHQQKNRLTLLRTIVWYLETFQNDPMETIKLANGKPAVELSFRFQSDIQIVGVNSFHDFFMLSGHLDRLANFSGGTWINDHKTTYHEIRNNEFFKRYSPDNQMSFYDYAGRVVYHQPIQGIIVNAAQVLVTLSRFERGFVDRTEAEREEWYYETKWFLNLAVGHARSGFWPRNDKACGLYGGCPFREICGRPPSDRERWLKAGFVRRVWDPLQVRGDI